MKTSKLSDLMGSLTLQQLRDLYFFIAMPSNRLLKRDVEIMRGLIGIWKKGGALPIEEEIWKQVLGRNEMANQKRIRSRILGSLQRYVCLIQLETDANMKNMVFSRYCLTAQSGRNAEKALNTALAGLGNNQGWGPMTELIRFCVHEMFVEMGKDERAPGLGVEMMEASLNNFYEINRLRLICERANRCMVINSRADIKKLAKEAESISKSTQSVHIQAYCDVFRLIVERDSAYFSKLERYIASEAASLDKRHLKELYEHLMNFCIRKINAHDPSYAGKYLQFAESLEEMGEILNNGVMEIGRMGNFIASCLILNQYWKAIDFMKRYADSLTASGKLDRAPFLELNMAVLELQMGELGKCHDRITRFRSSPMYSKDVYYRLSCENLLLKVFFEEGGHANFLGEVSNFRKYVLSLDQVADEKKRPFLNFLEILAHLANKKEIDIEGVKGKILLTDFLWLKKVIKGGGQ